MTILSLLTRETVSRAQLSIAQTNTVPQLRVNRLISGFAFFKTSNHDLKRFLETFRVLPYLDIALQQKVLGV